VHGGNGQSDEKLLGSPVKGRTCVATLGNTRNLKIRQQQQQQKKAVVCPWLGVTVG
jgi:hypothetical protein